MPHVTEQHSICLCRRLVGTVSGAVCLMAAFSAFHPAWAADAFPAQRFTLESIPLPPASVAASADPHAVSLRDGSASGLHLRWSWDSRRANVGVGAGAEWASNSNASAFRPMWGVHADLADSTRLTYEVRSGVAPISNGLMSDPSAQARWTLEVKPSQNPLQQFRSGVLRMQLSSTSTLALKPRGGGLTVSWQSRF